MVSQQPAQTITTLDQSYLSQEQVIQLLQFVDRLRVQQVQGKSNMAAYDIRAHLNRIFGFGRWDGKVICMDLIYESPYKMNSGKDGIDVAYKAGYELTVKAPAGNTLATYTEYAVGAQKMGVTNRGDVHDFAMKTAESQALKRAATNLGDQFGLSLYNKGSMDAIVGGTFLFPGRKDALALTGPTEQLAAETDPDFDNTLLEDQPNQQQQTPPPPSPQERYQQAQNQPPAVQHARQQPSQPAEQAIQEMMQQDPRLQEPAPQQEPAALQQQPAPTVQQVPQGPFEPGSIEEGRASLQADIQKLSGPAKLELTKRWGQENLAPLYKINNEDDLAMCWALYGAVVKNFTPAAA